MLIKNESSPHPDGFNFHLEDDNQTISFGDSGDSTLVRYHGLFQHETTDGDEKFIFVEVIAKILFDNDDNDNEDPFVSGHDYKCESCNVHFKDWPKFESNLMKKHSKKELVKEIYFKELKTVAFIKEKFEKGAGKVYGQGQYSDPAHKGRGKCRKCVACLRPKCGECDYCTKPYKHKGCREKVCLYPDPVTRPKSPELE